MVTGQPMESWMFCECDANVGGKARRSFHHGTNEQSGPQLFSLFIQLFIIFSILITCVQLFLSLQLEHLFYVLTFVHVDIYKKKNWIIVVIYNDRSSLLKKYCLLYK